ncbi:MAG: hypothetical protein WCP29_11440 [Acidobacteriota bacterium]
MTRHNLSTRPFYNQRAVSVVLTLVALVAAGATAFNIWQVVALSGRSRQLTAGLKAAEATTTDFRRRAALIRASINAKDLAVTTRAADEANQLIDRRVFSWTDLFNQFETTLPESVRIASVRPRIERDVGMVVAFSVVARNSEGIDGFIEKLEQTGAFAGLLSREEFVREDGMWQATIEGRYRPVLAPRSQPAAAKPTTVPPVAAPPAPAQPAATKPTGAPPTATQPAGVKR